MLFIDMYALELVVGRRCALTRRFHADSFACIAHTNNSNDRWVYYGYYSCYFGDERYENMLCLW